MPTADSMKFKINIVINIFRMGAIGRSLFENGKLVDLWSKIMEVIRQ